MWQSARMANVAGSSFSVARRQLGRRLRRLREEAAKGHDDVAEAHIASRTKMWKIEAGRCAVKPGDVLALARLYGIDPGTTDELVALASASRTSGFQEDHAGAVPEWVGLYGDLVDTASALHIYSCELVHGLLQTTDYARAVTAAVPGLNPEAIEQRVRFRLGRQQTFFERPAPGRLDVVMTAGALGLVVGSPAVMEAQIAHLRAVDAGDGVSVSVLPATNGVHAAMQGDFTIMEFTDPDDPPLVYLESLIGSRYVERPDQLAEFRRAFDRIRAQAVPLKEYVR
jgi:Domain of unknown function (DUF5753)/Helix-turn-helix domain